VDSANDGLRFDRSRVAVIVAPVVGIHLVLTFALDQR
jgi:hypothetical protein